MSQPLKRSNQRARTELRVRAQEIRNKEKSLFKGIDQSYLVTQAKAEKCRRRLSYFVKAFWETIVTEPLKWNWHMDVLCDEIQIVYERVFQRLPKEYDLVINVPPGTSKSTIVSVMAQPWSWTNDPTLRHMSGSYGGDLPVSHATKSRDIIRSEQFQSYFPEVQIKSDADGKTNYFTIYGGQRYCTSVGTSPTGEHFHVITVDDPLNTKVAAQKVEIDKANVWMDNLVSRKVDKKVTVTILIMQRLAVNDPTGHMLQQQKKHGIKVKHICLPATVSKHVKPAEYAKNYINGYLDPVRLDDEAMNEARARLGSAQYAGQFDQTPTPDGGYIWKNWFIPVPDDMFPSRETLSRYGTDWDLSYTEKEENSASAYVTAGRIKERMYIDDIGWDWLEFPKLIKYMKNRPSPHYIEAKASGKSAKSVLTKQGITAIEVSVKGGDKIARANNSVPKAEEGVIYIRQSLVDSFYNDSKQGILFFPRAECTDLADALAQSIQRIFAGGWIVSSTSDDDSDMDDDDWERYTE